MKLSVAIPAHDEAEAIGATVEEIAAALTAEAIDFEILVVDDGSADGTAAEVERLAEADPRVRCLRSPFTRGFGFAVRAALDGFAGDAVAIAMADGSDDPADLVRYYRVLEEGFDCAFGSRFVPGASVSHYPRLKLVINRVANWAVRIVFRHGYNDTTNAFKAYRREVIDGVMPLLSNHFNITVELPLKAVVRGYSYCVLPISWRGREAGRSKFELREMGSRYLFIALYVFLEHHLTRGDYRRPGYRGIASRQRRELRAGLEPQRSREPATPPD